METKICSHCKEEKLATLEYFFKCNKVKSGLSAICKNCSRVYSKNHYKENKEKIDSRNKEYWENNKEKYKENRAKYVDKNKEVIKEKAKIFRETHKDEIKAQRKLKDQKNGGKITKREMLNNTGHII